jgi:hypothetical protein
MVLSNLIIIILISQCREDHTCLWDGKVFVHFHNACRYYYTRPRLCPYCPMNTIFQRDIMVEVPVYLWMSL